MPRADTRNNAAAVSLPRHFAPIASRVRLNNYLAVLRLRRQGRPAKKAVRRQIGFMD